MWGPGLMQLRGCKSCICCLWRLQGYVIRDFSLLCCCCRLQMFLLRLWAVKLYLGTMLGIQWLIW